ncbi:MAG: hypothetical protein BWX63_00084 [Bacteroidetes bacterium ADurb.Bin041]|nr:MAG: hypothetical protein BWX63_00084 [Bacteroidetes bacterium ADurb.Bin041]
MKQLLKPLLFILTKYNREILRQNSEKTEVQL